MRTLNLPSLKKTQELVFMDSSMVPVRIKSILPTSNGSAIFLGSDEKTFVIYIDPFIGNALSLAIKGVQRERPLTHDLISNLLAGFEITLERVVINDRKEETFFARMIFKMENELAQKWLELDSRPSDAMVLATQLKKPIYCQQKVIDSVEDMTDLLEDIMRNQDFEE